MYTSSLEEARRVARKTRAVALELKHTDVVVCAPFVFIPAVSPRTKVPHYHVGAQTVSFHDSGAHTGEVSAAMLKDIGAEYVIIGHSEERAAGETDHNVAKRTQIALETGLIPIVCVGEKTRDEAGGHFEFIREQMKNSLADIPKSHARDIVIAYEPVWAIGAQEAMAPEQIYEMALFVKKVFADMFSNDSGLKLRVLYGGSVNFRNAADIMKIGQVDGLLVGRESVNVSGFSELIKVVDTAHE